MDNILIFGSSGHAKVIIDIVEKAAKFNIAGIVDNQKDVGQDFFGYKIIGKDRDIAKLIEVYLVRGGIVAVGDNYIRSKVVEAISAIIPEFKFVSTVHPSATIGKNVTIGDGTVVMAGATINPCCTLEAHTIINTNSSLDHDSNMGEFASLGPNAVTGGNVSIGAYTAIGIGAALIQGIKIGEHAVIGAGSTVVKDIAAYKVAYGSPAKFVRDRSAGDKYL